MCRVPGLCSEPAVTDVASFTTELSEPLLHLGEVGVSSILDPKERTQVKPRRASQRLLPFVPPEVASRAGLSNASGRAAFSRSRRHSSVESRCEGPGSITGGRGEPLFLLSRTSARPRLTQVIHASPAWKASSVSFS